MNATQMVRSCRGYGEPVERGFIFADRETEGKGATITK